MIVNLLQLEFKFKGVHPAVCMRKMIQDFYHRQNATFLIVLY
jgi:hypothetical protein